MEKRRMRGLESVSEQHLFESLVQLLGTRKGDPQFESLVQDSLREIPLVNEHRHVTFYDFPKSGLQILQEQQCFKAVIFFIEMPSTKSGHMKQYGGNFPAAIHHGDSKETVRRKLGMEPRNWRNESQDYWESYDFPNFELTFIFDGKNEMMSSVSIRHKVPS
jgi:hypothetical protein